MRKSIFILLFSMLCLPAASGQESTIKLSPPMRLSSANLSAPTAVIPVKNRLTGSRRPMLLAVSNQEPRDSAWQEGGDANVYGYSPAGGVADRNSSAFNASQPISKALINPDQFWTRKDRPILDSTQHHLFGDPNCACDEWAGICGCCGLKANAGHLGQKWLSSGEPCECIDNCCPNKGCGRSQKCK